jgi:hypothetical chaperone protein
MSIAPDDISIGIDFGTTNTVIALAGPDGQASALQFNHAGIVHRTYNTALCFWEETQGAGAKLSVAGAPGPSSSFCTASSRIASSSPSRPLPRARFS